MQVPACGVVPDISWHADVYYVVCCIEGHSVWRHGVGEGGKGPGWGVGTKESREALITSGGRFEVHFNVFLEKPANLLSVVDLNDRGKHC